MELLLRSTAQRWSARKPLVCARARPCRWCCWVCCARRFCLAQPGASQPGLKKPAEGRPSERSERSRPRAAELKKRAELNQGRLPKARKRRGPRQRQTEQKKRIGCFGAGTRPAWLLLRGRFYSFAPGPLAGNVQKSQKVVLCLRKWKSRKLLSVMGHPPPPPPPKARARPRPRPTRTPAPERPPPRAGAGTDATVSTQHRPRLARHLPRREKQVACQPVRAHAQQKAGSILPTSGRARGRASDPAGGAKRSAGSQPASAQRERGGMMVNQGQCYQR